VSRFSPGCLRSATVIPQSSTLRRSVVIREIASVHQAFRGVATLVAGAGVLPVPGPLDSSSGLPVGRVEKMLPVVEGGAGQKPQDSGQQLPASGTVAGL